ncbi:MAG: hypothetical protein WAN72_11775 [Candidatus Acidiferrales bacterium]
MSTTKQYHEETQAERDARHQAEVAAASAPKLTPEQQKAQRLANEAAHIASQDFMASEPRYIPSVENGAALHHAILQKYGGVYSPENLAAAFQWCVDSKLIAPTVAKLWEPETPLEHARSRGWTRRKIDATPPAKLREMIKDPFVKQMVEAIYAAGE